MRAVFEFGKTVFVPFVGGFIANKVLDETYNKSRDLMVDKNLEAEAKLKKLEAQIAENNVTIKKQQELMTLQKNHSDDLSKQVQRKLFELDDLEKKTKY